MCQSYPKASSFCPGCGSRNKEGSYICSNCGARIEISSAVMPQSYPKTSGFCPACGSRIEEGSHICPNCGTRIERASRKWPNRRNRIDKGLRICPNCGSRIDKGKLCPICEVRSTKQYGVGTSTPGKFINQNPSRICPNCGKEIKGIRCGQCNSIGKYYLFEWIAVWILVIIGIALIIGLVLLPVIQAIQSIPPPPPRTEILVRSTPAGAQVFLDGKDLNIVTPGDLTVDHGKHVVRVERDGYLPQEQIVQIQAGQQLQVEFRLNVLPPPAMLMIRSEPIGAKVFVNGVDYHATTPFDLTADPGEHVVRVELAGYEPQERRVAIKTNQKINVQFTLSRLMFYDNWWAYLLPVLAFICFGFAYWLKNDYWAIYSYNGSEAGKRFFIILIITGIGLVIFSMIYFIFPSLLPSWIN